MNQKIFLEVLTFLLVVLFLYASLSKLFDFELFYVQVNQSPLITGLTWVPFLTIGSELLACFLLVIPSLRGVGYFLSLGLMGTFTAYIVAILKYSPYVPCSCGGILDSMGWREHLLFNITFVVISLICCLLHYEITLKEEERQFEAGL